MDLLIKISNYLLPCILVFIVVYGLFKKIDVFSSFVSGAKEGVTSSISILPTIVAIILAINMFRLSGGLDIIVNLLSPITDFLNIPKEVLPLGLIRPISASSATVLLENIYKTHGTDSFIGTLASIITGSTETTFYTIAVYFSVVRVKKTGCLVGCSLLSDFSSFIFSCLLVSMFF